MKQIDCPSVEQLESCLDTLAAHDTALESHLQHCEVCRDTLEELAGGDHWWTTARDTLEIQRSEQVTRITESICALTTESGSKSVDDPLLEHELEHLKNLLAPASHPELLGRLGRYELEQLVGRGGMGLVFRGRDAELHRVVAVKTLAIHLIPIGAARDRFIREARASASLVHPHIVPVHDVLTDGPVPALVMQFVPGLTLSHWLSERGPMDWQQTLQIGWQLADALDTAHEKGLVHRDIKPGNVLLEADGTRALLTDFGLVRALDDATFTKSGTLTGTPEYMSPEQARGREVAPTTDLFSLGSLLYAMLTGHPPFRAPDAMAILNRICHDPHRPVRQLRPDVPLEFAKLVDKLLAKEPRHRYASAAAVRDELALLSRADHRLSVAKHRRRKVLVGGLSAIVLLVSSLLFAFAGGWGIGKGANKPAGELVEGEAARRQQELRASYGVLNEMQIIDERISMTSALTNRLKSQFNRRVSTEELASFDPFDDVQIELKRLDGSVKQLQRELLRNSK